MELYESIIRNRQENQKAADTYVKTNSRYKVVDVSAERITLVDKITNDLVYANKQQLYNQTISLNT